MLLGHSIGKIFYSEAASNLNKGELDKNISKYFKLLFHIALPFLFICIFLVPDVFAVVFNEQWSDAGLIVQILSPWLFVTFIAAPLSTIPTIYYKQELEFKFNSFILIGRFLTLGIGVYYNNLFLALILYSLSNALIWILYLIYMMKLSNIKIRMLVLKCMDNKYEHFMIVSIIIGIYILINNHVYTLICMIPLLIYLVYSFILESRKI